ncbi:N-terminal acetyltransferase [Beauveria asiatica]|uniref:N-terminal acetyltransferase n=1 Tax=Beauveria asiatica TaxID=1069075 RepID=A0AAW0RSL2_9HYPO
MTSVRGQTQADGIPNEEYQGWKNYSANVAFDGDGPTAPLPMNEATVHNNLGSQQVRFVHDRIDNQQRSEARIWTYRFPELEFFQEDFEVQSCSPKLQPGMYLQAQMVSNHQKVNTANATNAIGPGIPFAFSCVRTQAQNKDRI